MNQYIQIEFKNISLVQSDVLIAQLNEAGFTGFVQEDSFGEEEDNRLKAFIHETDFTEGAVKKIAAMQNLSFTQSIIKETNWNEVWESNFQPVLVDDFVGIRADFHKPLAARPDDPFGRGVEHEIIITPKMSFGTGHHATTLMMIQQMREIDFTAKTVFDFGTGTGILAILAEKLGAKKIIAVDNDDWSIANTAENLEKNKSSKTELKKSDSAAGDGHYDIILANINKNVILDNFSILRKRLSSSGILLVSGILEEDEAAILKEAKKISLRLIKKMVNNNWISLRFSR